jgi:hypothetical protein
VHDEVDAIGLRARAIIFDDLAVRGEVAGRVVLAGHPRDVDLDVCIRVRCRAGPADDPVLPRREPVRVERVRGERRHEDAHRVITRDRCLEHLVDDRLAVRGLPLEHLEPHRDGLARRRRGGHARPQDDRRRPRITRGDALREHERAALRRRIRSRIRSTLVVATTAELGGHDECTDTPKEISSPHWPAS